MTTTLEPWIVGTDDFATETQTCDGWTYFALSETKASLFEAQGREILKKTPGIRTFHGKKYQDGHRDAFLEFLRLIRKYLKGGGRAVNVLFDKRFKAELVGFAKRLSRGSMQGSVLIGIEDNIEVIVPYASVLVASLHALESIGPNAEMQFYLDDDTALPNIAESKIIELMPGASRQGLLKIFTNAYRKLRFPGSPLLSDYPVEKMKDDHSMLIQAADVLGNFSLAHIFTHLGDVSRKRIAKAKILDEVFGDSMEGFDFSSHIMMDGNDFYLKGDNACLTFQIGLEPI